MPVSSYVPPGSTRQQGLLCHDLTLRRLLSAFWLGDWGVVHPGSGPARGRPPQHCQDSGSSRLIVLDVISVAPSPVATPVISAVHFDCLSHRHAELDVSTPVPPRRGRGVRVPLSRRWPSSKRSCGCEAAPVFPPASSLWRLCAATTEQAVCHHRRRPS